MRLFLVDVLRCPEPHADSWLVASTGVMQDRHVIDGELGCPVCGARYRVHEGVARLGSRKPGRVSSAEPTEQAVVRLGALLGLDSPGGVVLLARAHAPMARALRDATRVEILQLDPPPDVAMGEGISGIAGAPRAPLAAGSLRGAALDADTADAEYVASVVAALRPHARLIAPASTPRPAGLRELARDTEEWVAEKESAAPTVTLRRA